jgi:hypothetical protein
MMIKNICLLLILFISNFAFAGTKIYKVVDALTGKVTYGNVPSAYKGKISIVKLDGITHLGNEHRSSLSGQIVKNGTNSFRYSSGANYPTIFSHFSDKFGSKTINKSRFSNLISDAAYKHGVEEKLVHAVIQTESAYNSAAVSRTGAVGLMQLMPDTARRFGVTNRTDPVQNINGGTRYLRVLLDMFDDIRLAVAAYNAGENAVIKYNNSIPPYPETQNYVRQVLALYHNS